MAKDKSLFNSYAFTSRFFLRVLTSLSGGGRERTFCHRLSCRCFTRLLCLVQPDLCFLNQRTHHWKLRCRTGASRRALCSKSWLLALGVAANLCVLGYFKYSNFFVDKINAVLGIEFYLGELVYRSAFLLYVQENCAVGGRVRGKDLKPQLLGLRPFCFVFPSVFYRRTNCPSQRGHASISKAGAGASVCHCDGIDDFCDRTRQEGVAAEA